MSERLVVDAYFVTEEDIFAGKLDEAGTIDVCGTRYIGYDGIKRNFTNRKREKHSIKNILVKLEDFTTISDVLLVNGVEIGQDAEDGELDPALPTRLSTSF